MADTSIIIKYIHIDFVNWIFDNHFYLYNINKQGIRIYKSESIKGNYTTETLFEIFLNEQKYGGNNEQQ